MWKIKRKYLFIELMTYLEHKHTQTLLFRACKNFRHRLIHSLKSFENLQKNSSALQKCFKVDLLYDAIQNSLGLFKYEKNKIYLSSHSGISLDINLIIHTGDTYKVRTLGECFQKNIAKVRITINTSFEKAYKFYVKAKNLLDSFFRNTKQIEYIIINLISKLDQKKVVLQKYITFTVQLLKLNINEPIFLSVECLQHVRLLQLHSTGDDQFNVKFENLSVKYPLTNFTLCVVKPKCSNIIQIYQLYPDLFNFQNCKIILKWECYNYFEINEFQILLEKFHENLFILKLDHVNVNKNFNYLMLLQQQYKNLIEIKITSNFQVDSKFIDGQLRVNKLKITNNGCMSHELFVQNLANLKITSHLTFCFVVNLKICKPDKQLDCPPKITAAVTINKNGWIKPILEMFDCFKNYKNVSDLTIMTDLWEKPYGCSLISLYTKIEEFANLRELTIPFSLGKRVNQRMMHLLKKLVKLVQLKLQFFFDLPEIEIASVVNLLSHYAIEKMMDLRMLNFYVNTMKNIQLITKKQRASPLTITVDQSNGQTNYIYDTNKG